MPSEEKDEHAALVHQLWTEVLRPYGQHVDYFFFFRKTGFMKVNEGILVRGAQELSGADKLHCEFMYRQVVH